MSHCVFELNDSEIRVARDNEIVLCSPGYALIDNDRIELGLAAARQARLHPRAVHNRYWKNLNQDPLQYPTARARHNADLAFAHLLAIHEKAGKPEEVIFTVPGSYTNEQLALLLGLVEASPFKAVGLVDSAVAATSVIAGRGSYVHIDIHLHHVVLTRIKVDEQVNRISVQVIEGPGLVTIYDTVAQLITDLFVRESRFDPLHYPETEQALYDQIPACLHALQSHSEVPLEIQYQQTQHQARLPAAMLLQALQGYYQKIIAALNVGDTCLLSDRIAELPGLMLKLPAAETLSANAIFQACQEHAARITSSGSSLNYVTSLPTTSEPLITEIARHTVAATADGSAEKLPITHILLAHNAHRLHSERLYLSASGTINTSEAEDSHCSVMLIDGKVQVNPESEFTVFVNGRQLQHPIEVEAGGIISFIGSKTEYSFIHVSD